MRTPSAGPLAKPLGLERVGIDRGAIVEAVQVADIDDVIILCPRKHG